MGIPNSMQQTYKEIAAILKTACQPLRPVYYEVCLEVLEKLCRMRPSPLNRGWAVTWAGGILHAVGHQNLLFCRQSPTYRPPHEVLRTIPVNQTTASTKGAWIRKTLHFSRGSAQWMRPALEEGNPLLWWVSINGVPTDVRTLPPGAQRQAVRRGLIPVAPADWYRKPASDAPAQGQEKPEPVKDPPSEL